MLSDEDELDPTTTPWPDMIPGPDGNLWFTDREVSGQFSSIEKIGRITPVGIVTEFPLPNNDGAGEIMFGPDRNLWFIVADEVAKDRIGQITPAGIITEFPVPNRFSVIHGFTFGPDGNLWFPEQTAAEQGGKTSMGRFILSRP